MSWYKLDDKSHSHPKVVCAGNEAWGCHTRIGTWCADYLTDGVIPGPVAMGFAGGNASLLETLVDVGLLEPDGDGYLVHDFLDYNPTRAAVEVERARTRERVARSRGRKCDCNGVTSPLVRPEYNGPVPVPEPAPLDGEGGATLTDHASTEQAGYKRFGALVGSNAARILNLVPIQTWEWEATMGTPARSWSYACKVLENIREEHAKGPAPPGSPHRPPKPQGQGTWIDAQRRMMEEAANEDRDGQEPVLVDDGEATRLLPPTDE